MGYCTRLQVKRAKSWSVTETTWDQLIDELIQDATSEIDSMLGRPTLQRTSYTEYLDGGNRAIVLSYRPVHAITTVHDDPSREWDATTLIDASDYVLDRKELGILRMKVGRFLPGSGSVKVVYDAGYDPVPPLVRRLAVEMVIRQMNRRQSPELINKSNKDGSVSKTDDQAWDLSVRRRLAPLI